MHNEVTVQTMDKNDSSPVADVIILLLVPESCTYHSVSQILNPVVLLGCKVHSLLEQAINNGCKWKVEQEVKLAFAPRLHSDQAGSQMCVGISFDDGWRALQIKIQKNITSSTSIQAKRTPRSVAIILSHHQKEEQQEQPSCYQPAHHL